MAEDPRPVSRYAVSDSTIVHYLTSNYPDILRNRYLQGVLRGDAMVLRDDEVEWLYTRVADVVRH